jgi:hypothetical protein
MGDKEIAYRHAAGINEYWGKLGFFANARATEVSDPSVRACEAGAAISQATSRWVVTSDLTSTGMPAGCHSRLVPIVNAPKKRAEG